MSTHQRFVNWGPHEVPTATEIGKELLRHERPADYNPRNHQFPKMVYKAYLVDGRVMCMDIYPKQWGFATLEQFRMACEGIDNFNQSCQLEVNGPEMQSRAFNDGWRESPDEARQVIFDAQKADAQGYAERAHADRNMSDKAKAEAQAVDDSTPRHVVSIPESPTVKREHWKTRQAREAREASGKVA